jgi:hypothetical protein
MIGSSSYVLSTIMVTRTYNVHYYERYVNIVYSLDGFFGAELGGIPVQSEEQDSESGGE